jgi:hypothetical protein
MSLLEFHFYNLLYARNSGMNLLFTCLPSESYWLSHINILSSQIHFSATIPKAHNSAQVNFTFFIWVRCALITLVNETETTLQLHSSGWPVVVSVGFEEVYFYHSVTYLIDALPEGSSVDAVRYATQLYHECHVTCVYCNALTDRCYATRVL